MLQLSGYEFNEALHVGPRFATYRGVRQADASRVVAKVPVSRRPSRRDSARLKHEFEMARLVDGTGVVRPLALENDRDRLVLVLEDFGGVSLKQYLEGRRLQLHEFFRLAIQCADVLHRVHQAGVIHKDIKPSNLILHQATYELRLTDFGVSSRLIHEGGGVRTAARMEGTPAYMAPEQTGRMNRSVDGRADLYALGATFYEMLAGRPPFDAQDRMELIYCHLALTPRPPHEVRSDVPPAVSAVVMKLLAKTTEERYQTAAGLKADLVRLERQLQATGEVMPFPLGAHDHPREFRPLERLYGRSAALDELNAAFDRVAQGASEVVAVSGFSGIGKSALVSELQRPVTTRRGAFIAGKFDQLQRSIPYHALIQAFQELTRQLLTETAARVEAWRRKLLDALSPIAQVIVDVVPEVGIILGPQPPVPALGPAESEIRFHRAVRQFVRALAGADHPLVIFLDDLQWADAASLALIRLLLTDRELTHLLLVVAYRENEVDAGHPVTATLEDLRRQGVRVRTLALGSLERDHVVELLSDTLRAGRSQVEELAELVIQKTAGNPFFVQQFLTTLHRKGLVAFDDRLDRFTWDVERIRGENITDNVGEMISGRIAILPDDARRLVQLGACLGASFDLHTLSQVSERSPLKVAGALEPALNAGLIEPVGEGHEYVDLVSGPPSSEEVSGGHARARLVYRFIHDRVQHAAYQSVPEAERPRLHRTIGQLLLKAATKETLDEQVFEIAGHLNAAAALPATHDEQLQRAELSLRAGQRALQSSAYDTAMQLLDAASQALPTDCWETAHELAFAVHEHRARAAYLSARFDLMEELADLLLERARTVLERARIHELRINCYTSRIQWSKVVETGLEALRMLGQPLPSRPGKVGVVLSLLWTKLKLRGKKVEALPEMTDPQLLAAMRILKLTAAAAYFSLPDLFPLITFRMVQLSIRHGNTALSAYAYTLYGLILSAVLGDYDGGLAFGRLGLHVMDRQKAAELKAPLLMLYNIFIRHWKEPLRATVGPLLEGAQAGLDAGDLEYFSYDHYWAAEHAFYTAEPLQTLRATVDRSLRVVGKQKQEKGHLLLLHVRHLIDQLTGASELGPPEGDLPEEEIVPRWRAAGDQNALCYAFVHQAVARFFAGDLRGCAERMAICDENPQVLAGQSFVPFFRFYQALAHLGLAREEPARRRAHLARAASTRRSFARWARHAPENFVHKLELITAELARARERPAEEVEGAYRRSIQAARQQGYVHDEALAHELAGEYHLSRGLEVEARGHLREARRLYLRWGASVRARKLQERYPELLGPAAHEDPAHHSVPVDTTSTTTEQVDGTSSEALDLQSMMRAAQAISSEIVLEDVICKLMGIVMENAGAQRGVLALARDGELTIRAEADHGGDEIRLSDGRPAESSGVLPVAIANYVFRTMEPVVLTDATHEARYAADPYVVARHPRSVLCAPLVYQGKAAGVLYLENNLTPGAFTSDRIQIVQLLSGQAAVSLRNAELYSDLRKALDKEAALTSAHGRFVPYQFLSSLNRDNIVDVRRGDQVRKEMSILFADIRGFTGIAEKLGDQTLAFVNNYLEQVERPVLDAGGFIDSFSGDGVMALFDGSPDRAVEGAINMHLALDAYNRERARRGEAPIITGVGINTGSVMLGTIGGRSRLSCGVIGDAVNLAARVEGLTKRYGSRLLLTEHTLARLQQPTRWTFRRIERVRVLGRDEAVTVYEQLDAEPVEQRARKAATLLTFHRALDLYYAREFGEALELFEGCQRADPDDIAAALFCERCRELIRTGVSDTWDGIVQITHK
jgi:predicted ATPase/class 3 adenylate cyclase